MLCEYHCTTCAPGTTEPHRTETKDVQLQKRDAEIERQQKTIQALEVHIYFVVTIILLKIALFYHNGYR